MIKKLLKRILDYLYHRHQDKILLRDPDLKESLRQMRAGETKSAWTSGEESEAKR